MSLAVISDIHIVDEGDKGYQTFTKFLAHEKVQTADKIFLLGDIFDIMCGPHEEYYERYRGYFEKIAKLLNQGREIHYFEGNHDLHLKKLYENYFSENSVRSDKFILHDRPYVWQCWGRKYFFAHGDEIELGNYNYKIYKAIITSPPLRFVANYIMTYKFLHYHGEKASHASREHGAMSFDEATYRESFRMAAYDMASNGYDYIVCGHSHIKDDYQFSEKGDRHFTYLNNGFAQASNSFIYLDQSGHEFVNI